MICSSIVNLIILVGVVIPGQPPASLSSPVDFFKEKITLTVSDSVATVNGIFYFRNNRDRDKPFPVLFPFYVDSVTHFPREINAYIINDNDTLTVNFEPLVERGAIRMGIPMKSNAVTVWHLDYSQRIESPRARYILTSTSAWKKPLEEASYYFIVPENFKVVSVWPEPDNSGGDEIKTLWCHKTNFMPKRDMEITWKRK